MGIRFSCSNGHKLNVKAALAGRRGFCPQCGVAVQIPLENEQAAKPTVPVIADTTEAKKPETPPEMPPATPEVKPPGSALLSDPNAVWYLQVPHGPQYGPATGAVVENWIKERRVSPEMLVWKEGWSNWLEAKNAFPDLAQLISNSPNRIDLPAATNESAPSEISAVSLTPRFRGKIKKKQKLSRNVIITTVLVGMIVLLGGLLFWKLNH